MQLTVKISDARLKESLNAVIEDFLLVNYDDAVLKEANVPKKAVLLKEMLADEKYIRKIEKEMMSLAKEKLDDYMYDVIYDVQSDIMIKHIDACDIAWKKLEQLDNVERAAKRKAEEIKNAKKLLEEEGYKVS